MCLKPVIGGFPGPQLCTLRAFDGKLTEAGEASWQTGDHKAGMFTVNDRIVTFLPPETIEPEALQQLYNTSESPVLAHHLAVMPDCHFGSMEMDCMSGNSRTRCFPGGIN